MDFAYLVEFTCNAGMTKSQCTLFILNLKREACSVACMCMLSLDHG